MYIRAYIDTYIYTNVYIFIHTYIHTYIHIYLHTYTHTCIHTYIHTYTRRYIHRVICYHRKAGYKSECTAIKFSMLINGLTSCPQDFVLVEDWSRKIYDVCNPTSAVHKPEAVEILGESIFHTYCSFSLFDDSLPPWSNTWSQQKLANEYVHHTKPDGIN